MHDAYISSPRPPWVDPEIKKTQRSVTLGGNSGGLVLYMTKKGLYINGYYSGLAGPRKYANLRDFMFISWEDFETLRQETMRGKPKEKEVPARQPDQIDEAPDKAYLETLPIVTLNGIDFYIDVERQERRPVVDPTGVFNFEKQAGEEPR